MGGGLYVESPAAAFSLLSSSFNSNEASTDPRLLPQNDPTLPSGGHGGGAFVTALVSEAVVLLVTS